MSEHNLVDELLDIREVTYENYQELAKLSGRSEEAIKTELDRAHGVNSKVMLLVNNPLIRPRKRPHALSCDYVSHWSALTGWSYVCVFHGSPSWHSVAENPNAPCTTIDPKPEV